MSKIKIIVGLIIFLVIIYIGFATDTFRTKRVYDFESCLAYGNPVMESYPRKCKHKDGIIYGELITIIQTPNPNTTINTDIHLDSPISNDVATSPLLIKGQALGKWFFEASFPVSLVDEEGNILVSSHVTALSDWMKEDFVPFTASVIFDVSTTTRGFVVLKNDNPSGDPARDVFFKIPVIFEPK